MPKFSVSQATSIGNCCTDSSCQARSRPAFEAGLCMEVVRRCDPKLRSADFFGGACLAEPLLDSASCGETTMQYKVNNSVQGFSTSSTMIQANCYFSDLNIFSDVGD